MVPPYDATSRAASSTNRRNPAPARGVAQPEVDTHVHAAVAEVPVGDSVEPVVDEERVEGAEVLAEPVGRHGGVLPAGVRRGVEAPGGEAGAVLPDPPQRRLLGRVGDDPGVRGAARVGDHRACARDRLGLGVAGELGEEPGRAPRQVGGRAAAGADHLHDALVEPLAGHQRVVEQTRHVVGRVEDGGVAEHGEHPVLRVAHQPHGGTEHHGERALAADQEPVEPAAVLGQQLLERITGDLAREPAELRADRAEVGLRQLLEPAGRWCSTSSRPAPRLR